MEYLFVLSLIVIAAMVAIDYFGQSTSGNLGKSSDAILKATQGK